MSRRTSGTGSMGHADEADGIEEYDNPLPDWWLGLFWFTIIWAAAYALHYHFIADRSQEKDLAAELAAAASAGRKPRRPPCSSPPQNWRPRARRFTRPTASPAMAPTLKGGIGPDLTDEAGSTVAAARGGGRDHHRWRGREGHADLGPDPRSGAKVSRWRPTCCRREGTEAGLMLGFHGTRNWGLSSVDRRSLPAAPPLDLPRLAPDPLPHAVAQHWRQSGAALRSARPPAVRVRRHVHPRRHAAAAAAAAVPGVFAVLLHLPLRPALVRLRVPADRVAETPGCGPSSAGSRASAPLACAATRVPGPWTVRSARAPSGRSTCGRVCGIDVFHELLRGRPCAVGRARPDPWRTRWWASSRWRGSGISRGSASSSATSSAPMLASRAPSGRGTLTIGYDAARGSRGARGQRSGRCIDCHKCVVVCPPGSTSATASSSSASAALPASMPARASGPTSATAPSSTMARSTELQGRPESPPPAALAYAALLATLAAALPCCSPARTFRGGGRARSRLAVQWWTRTASCATPTCSYRQ